MKAVRRLSLVILLMLPITTFAWSSLGHKLVMQIAYDQLTPQTKDEISHLLYHSQAEGSQTKHHLDRTLLKDSVFADQIKGNDVKVYNHWHFIDKPFAVDDESLPPIESQNVVWAIKQCLRVLSSPHANREQKRLFLKFLIHFVGDIHQPLHCATRVSQSFPHGDAGGNQFLIHYHQYHNLHALWDHEVGAYDHRSKRHRKSIKMLAEQLESVYPKDSFKKKWQRSDPSAWALESFKLAEFHAYQTAPSTTPNFEYIQENQALAKQQLALAGYRLGYILNSVFGGKEENGLY